jgi:hypothetical protein
MTQRTRLVSLTTPHNPTGTTLSPETLREVIALVERAGARLLLDETYREMTYGEPLPVAAGLSPSVISVSSLSKTYGLPGIRIGWLVTRDRALRDRFLAAKEQILISGSLVDESIALHALRRRPLVLPAIRARIDEAFTLTDRWLDGPPQLEHPRGRAGRPRRVLPGPVRGPRHDRGARALVRAAQDPLPPRLRLAEPRGAARGSRRDRRRAGADDRAVRRPPRGGPGLSRR